MWKKAGNRLLSATAKTCSGFRKTGGVCFEIDPYALKNLQEQNQIDLFILEE